MLAALVHQLGIREQMVWPGDDFDSIWIVTFNKGSVSIEKDIEGINPTDKCP